MKTTKERRFQNIIKTLIDNNIFQLEYKDNEFVYDFEKIGEIFDKFNYKHTLIEYDESGKVEAIVINDEFIYPLYLDDSFCIYLLKNCFDVNSYEIIKRKKSIKNIFNSRNYIFNLIYFKK